MKLPTNSYEKFILFDSIEFDEVGMVHDFGERLVARVDFKNCNTPVYLPEPLRTQFLSAWGQRLTKVKIIFKSASCIVE